MSAAASSLAINIYGTSFHRPSGRQRQFARSMSLLIDAAPDRHAAASAILFSPTRPA
jgi:hypothetical protein